MSARLATKRQKILLWTSSGGYCAQCGESIDHTFHADHWETPWSKSLTTNIHDMKALCPACNQRKGNSMFRKFQADMNRIMNDIVGGENITEILASVTPGGGKSALPVIVAGRLIRAGIIDSVMWVGPRINLCEQAEEAFQKKWLRGLIGHSHEIRALKNGNEPDPRRGLAGYSVTYDAIESDPKLHTDEMAKRRYMVVFDEIQHVVTGSKTHAALQGIWDKAVLRLLMTGSLERSDNRRIGFVPYKEVESGRAYVDLNKSHNRRVIQYRLSDALREEAVILLFFEHLNAKVDFVKQGEEKNITRLSDAGDDTRDALFTALQTDYARSLLEKAVDHWQHYRKNFNHRGRLIVVAPGIPLAKTYLKWLKEMGVDAGIATSDDDPGASNEIKRFRGKIKPVRPALVTVAKCYEGMDCPEITHLAALTYIRSKPWIEQMLARATRVDYEAGAWKSQAAFVFAPDDALFNECIQYIRVAQAPFVTERLDVDGGVDGGAGGGGGPRGEFTTTPLRSEATSIRASALSMDEYVDENDYEKLTQIAKEQGIYGASPVQLKGVINRFLQVKKDTAPAAEPPLIDVGELTPSQREEELRTRIQKFINVQCLGDGDLIKKMGGNIMRMFNKGRPDMTEVELNAVWTAREMWSRL